MYKDCGMDTNTVLSLGIKFIDRCTPQRCVLDISLMNVGHSILNVYPRELLVTHGFPFFQHLRVNISDPEASCVPESHILASNVPDVPAEYVLHPFKSFSLAVDLSNVCIINTGYRSNFLINYKSILSYILRDNNGQEVGGKCLASTYIVACPASEGHGPCHDGVGGVSHLYVHDHEW